MKLCVVCVLEIVEGYCWVHYWHRISAIQDCEMKINSLLTRARACVCARTVWNSQSRDDIALRNTFYSVLELLVVRQNKQIFTDSWQLKVTGTFNG